MQNKALHIVSFDNPYPPVYGGVVEVYSKVKALHELGVSVYLHCFVDVIPQRHNELSAICTQVFFYKISKNPLRLLLPLPYSVLCRTNDELLKNLEINDAPILFEGLKTTYWVYQGKLAGRRKILRLHNIEHDYYRGLSASETNIFKKIIFGFESKKYKVYENVIAKFDKVLTLSNFENRHAQSKFGNSHYIPVFHGNKEVAKLQGTGRYALYHGDLRLSDNLRVAYALVEIFREIPNFDLVIAGNANADRIRGKINGAANISVVPIKNFEKLKGLLHDAQVNLIFSYQRSGTKLKLMTALFNSRFCIINDNIMDDQRVGALCEHANSNEEIKAKIIELQGRPFNDYNQRCEVLESYMSDRENARMLMENIWGK